VNREARILAAWELLSKEDDMQQILKTLSSMLCMVVDSNERINATTPKRIQMDITNTEGHQFRVTCEEMQTGSAM
jgi:hypothetical protein